MKAGMSWFKTHVIRISEGRTGPAISLVRALQTFLHLCTGGHMPHTGNSCDVHRKGKRKVNYSKDTQ